jgi:hypothetical protein
MLRVRRFSFFAFRVSLHDVRDSAPVSWGGTLEHVGGDFVRDA